MLTNTQKRHLKSLAHHRRPVVSIGNNGLTAAVLREIELALDHHELVKIKIAVGERDLRARIVAEIASNTGAALIQQIGHTASLYRANPEQPRIELPRGR